MTAKLTPARRRALEVLVAAPGRSARGSNATAYSTESGWDPTINGQTLTWLIREGLVTWSAYNLGYYRLTDAGLEVARLAGIEVSP